MIDVIRSRGVVVQGHRVASGLAADARFPGGTIAAQLPLFEQRLPGFAMSLGSPIFPGTVNIRFAGMKVILRAPEHHLTGIAWTNWFPPEDFYLSKVQLAVGERIFPACLYIPDPDTKPDHHQPRDTIELLCGFVRGLRYGAPVELIYPATAIAVEGAG